MKRSSFKRGLKKQAGFAFLDVAFWISSLLTGSIYVGGMVAGEQDNLLAQRTVTDMAAIIKAGRFYKEHQEDGYTSISVTKLTDASVDYLAARFKTGVGVNLWGGDYTASVGTTASDLTVTATGLPTSVCNRIAAAANKEFDAACATGTVTIKTK